MSKRGRKKNDGILPTYTIEYILDYIIENYPRMDVHKIKNKVINGIKNKEHNIPVLLKLIHNNIIYYYDKNDTLYDENGIHIGFYAKHYSGERKIYLFKDTINELEENITKIKL